jgi:crotonobetainyl-CoA:carnitine CoA-transferase CaiB-like acyl-CoA transferase
MTEPIRAASGLRVLEVGSSTAAAIAGLVLADNGASVVKIEPPGGDALRAHPAFALWARGKESAVADLATPAGAARLRALAREADVLLLGLKPSAIDRFGLEHGALARDNPRLVWCAITGFGTRGPLRELPAYDGLVSAKVGRAHEFSPLFEGKRPVYPVAPVGPHAAAMLALQGIFGALRERESSGRGQRLETSLVHGLAVYDMVYWWPGAPRQVRTGDAPFIPYTVGRTADGVWLQFAQNGPRLFENFLRVVGLEAGGAQRPVDAPSRDAVVELRAFRARAQERLGSKTWEEWQRIFAGESEITVEPFLMPGDALAHPQLVAIGDAIEKGGVRQLGTLIQQSATPAQAGDAPPALGSLGGGGWPQPAHSGAPLGSASLRATGPSPWLAAPATRAEVSTRRGLFDGVTVLELATWIATPFAGAQLADLGARVIKIEPLEGDPMRSPRGVHLKMMQGKQSIALDLKHPQGREIVHRLVARADALTHNYRPGVPERLGIDWKTLCAINPRLVYLYGASYGSTGPMAYKAAFHVSAGALAGGARAQAGDARLPPPDARPSPEELLHSLFLLEKANESHPDFNASVVVAAAVALGLWARERSGAGQALETRMMLSNCYVLSKDFVDFPGRAPRELPGADLAGLSALYRLYPAAEDWVFLAAPTQRDFERLCAAADCGALARDPRFATGDSRAKHDTELAAELSRVFAGRSALAWEQALAPRGIGCVRASDQPTAGFILDHERGAELGWTAQVSESAFGAYKRYGRGVELAREAGPLGGAWRAGEHTRPILAELGYPDAEIERLLRERVVAEPQGPPPGAV